MTKRRGRLTRREQIESVNRGFSAWGAMFGKPEVAASLVQPLPKRRKQKADMRGVDIDAIHRKPLERDVLPAVRKALQLDRRVARVDRNQSGVFRDGNRFIRVGEKGKLDLTVFMKPGITPAWGEVEVKRDKSTKPEPHQLRRMERVRADGGFAGWCWDIESALEILP
jgi:hypothetical protein